MTPRDRDQDPVQIPTFLSLAAPLAARGWHVFPCQARGKRPLCKWSVEATTDQAQIETWARRYARSNVGIACGPSGLLVIDIDSEAGARALAEIEAQIGALPETYTVRTSKGEHLYYRAAGIRSSTGQLAAGIDTRGVGGYVVGPGSTHEAGATYEPIDERDPAELPAAWQDRLRAPKDRRPGALRGHQEPPPGGSSRYGLEALRRETQAVRQAEEGTRNRALNGAAFNVGQLVAGGELAEGEARAELASAAADAGLRSAEALRTIESGLQGGAKQPRTRPPPAPRAVPPPAPRPPRAESDPWDSSPDQSPDPPPEDDPDSLGWIPDESEIAIARTFARRAEPRWRYVARWGQWLEYDGTKWNEEPTLAAFDLARTIAHESARLAGGEPKAARAMQRKLCSAHTVSAIEHLARSDRSLAARAEQWDLDDWVLNTAGGLVDLRTGEIRPHRREDYCTRIAPHAPRAERATRWCSFLDEITAGDREMQSYLQRIAGYALTGSTQEHALFFAFGTGTNGKSVFLDTLRMILGSYATVAPMETFTETRGERHPTDVAGLRGARLVTSVETEEGRAWATARIKEMTGGDTIKARFMRQDFFEFKPKFKLLFAGNHKPQLRGVETAERRRFRILPFTVTIPDERIDKQLGAKLEAEAGAILHWAIEGCLAWQRDRLDPPKVVRDCTDAYFDAEDSLSAWLYDTCEADPESWEPTAMLFASWKLWAESNGEPQGTQRQLAQRLDARGFRPSRVGHAHTRAILGVRLRRGAP